MKKLFTILMVTILVISSAAQESCHNYYPAISPDGNTLYFCSDMDGNYLIYKANIDGSNVQAILSSELNVYSFRLSQDGSKIVFNYGPYDNTAEIFIMNNDGTDLTQLTSNSVWDGNPSFSPDGQQIVFDAWDDSHYPEIFIMNVDGSGRQQLTNEGGALWQSAPVFHPNGESIYFQAGFNADDYIVKMDTDGSNWVNITEPNDFGYSDSNIQFNLDGSQLAFATSAWGGYNGVRDIVTCNADGSDWVRVTDGVGHNYTPFFHPNGNKIFFASDIYTGNYLWDIVSTDLDGANIAVIYTCSDSGFGDLFAEKTILFCEPNPMTNETAIQIELNQYNRIEFVIFDNQGKTCKVDYRQTAEGIVLERGHLTTGIYFFAVSGDGYSLGSGKLIVQ